jgi:hypothetical protein
MTRVTEKMLEKQIQYLNIETEQPLKTWERIDGKVRANIGNYHLYRCHGVFALDRITNESGGVHRIFTASNGRELFNLICAYRAGMAGAK